MSPSQKKAAANALTDAINTIADACKPGDDCTKRLDERYLKQLKIDAEEVKYEELGRRAKISLYELCQCKDGSVVIRLRGCHGPIIPTGIKIP